MLRGGGRGSCCGVGEGLMLRGGGGAHTWTGEVSLPFSPSV